MAFKADYSKAQEGGNSLKPEGYYEVVVSTAEVSCTRNGKENINIVYTIRNDVAQGYQNGLIFHSIWKKSPERQTKEDISIGGFNYGNLMAVAKAAQFSKDKEYADLNAFLAELIGKPLRVHLYHDPYEGKVYEKVDKHEPTTLAAVKQKAKGKSAPAQNTAPAPAPVQNAAPVSDPYPF